MVQIDAAAAEQGGDLGVVGGSTVDVVLARVVFEGATGNDEGAVGDWGGFAPGGGVKDLAEVDLDLAVLEVGEVGGVVDQCGDLALAHFGGAEAEDEEEGVDDVGFAGAVGADDGGEGLDCGERSVLGANGFA